MNVDIRLSTNFLTNPKTVKLQRRAGAKAVLSLLSLWIWVAQNHPDGNLHGMDDEDVEIVAGWTGKKGKLVETLRELHFLDGDEFAYTVHDWSEHQEYASRADERREKARKAATERWSKAEQKNEDASGNAQKCSEHATSNAQPMLENATSTNEQCPVPNQTKEIKDKNTNTPLPPSQGGESVREPETPGSVLPQPTRRRPKKLDSPSKSDPRYVGFKAAWDVYPVQQGQEAAWCEWCRLSDNGTLEDAYVIREQIIRMTQEDSRWQAGYAPRMDKWLRDKGWNDEPYVRPASQVASADQPAAPTEYQKTLQDRRLMAQWLRQGESDGDNLSNGVIDCAAKPSLIAMATGG